MSDYNQVSIGQIKIVGGFFDDGMQIIGNPRVWSEERLDKLLAALYDVLYNHGVEGHIAITYSKSIGTKVNT